MVCEWGFQYKYEIHNTKYTIAGGECAKSTHRQSMRALNFDNLIYRENFHALLRLWGKGNGLNGLNSLSLSCDNIMYPRRKKKRFILDFFSYFFVFFQLLRHTPTNRLSLDDVLKHPWIVEMTKDLVKHSESSASSTSASKWINSS